MILCHIINNIISYPIMSYPIMPYKIYPLILLLKKS